MPWHLVFEESPDSYSVITEVEAFPTGVRFSIVSRYRPGAADADPRGRMRQIHQPDGPRFGVGFPDGRKAFTAAWLSGPRNEQPATPLLRPLGGGGGPGEWRQVFWLWPLPPSGPLTFVSSWPARSPEERSVVADASELVEAATRSRQLWDVDGTSAVDP